MLFVYKDEQVSLTKEEEMGKRKSYHYHDAWKQQHGRNAHIEAKAEYGNSRQFQTVLQMP